MKVRILAVTLGLLLAGPALAQAKKKDAKKGAAPAAAVSPADKKAEERKKQQRRGPAALKEALPRLEDAEKDAIADKKREEAIESLKKIIPKIEEGSPQKADLLFQLSEMYWEKSKFLYVKEMRKFQEDEKKVDEARNRGEKLADAKADHRESELYRSETMRLYETVLREYPAYDRKDEVLFLLGYNQYEIGKKELAVKRYEELIKSYPGSKFVPDTYVQLGNHYFDVANNLAKAKEMYERAYASTVPKIKSYALYKLAWCDFNAGEHEKALKKLQEVIDFAEKQGKTFTDLKNEALSDSVLMFVQLNRADDAIAYYKAHAGKKKQITLTTRLAFQLADAGHHDNAIKTFRLMLNDNPVAESAPDFQQAIIKSFEGLRQRENVKAETKKMADLYRPGSSWWKANESKKEVLRNGFSVAEEAMRTTVTEYHQEAQKTKQVETYRLARDIYKQYIDAFATSPDENFVSDQAFNLKFFYAEILWALEEWEPAAKQYQELANFKIPNRDEAKAASNEKYRQASSYNAILAYTKLVNIERGVAQKTELKDGQKIDESKKKETVAKAKKIEKRTTVEMAEKPLTGHEKSLVAACDTYNQLYPKNQDEVEVGYTAAVMYYDKNQFLEAAKRFGEMIMKYPEEKRALDAADMSMNVLEEKSEWFELNRLSRQFVANKKLAKPGSEFTKRAMGVVEGSQYKYVDEVIFKKDKNPKMAAEEFLKFVAEFPRSENADRALTYSMIIFQQANEIDRGIEAGERVLKEYPATIFDLKVKYALAFFYEKTANFEKSAAMYEDFIATYDAAAGAKAINIDNIKDLLKKEKEQKEKDAKGKPVAKAEKPKPKVAAAKAPPPAKPTPEKIKEREAQVKEAEGHIADSQFNAGLWWEGVGKSDKAIAAYNRYIARFKDKEDVPKISYNLALIYEKDKKLADALKVYDAFLTTYAKDKRVTDVLRLEAKYKQFLHHRTLKSPSDMDKLAKEIIAAYPKLTAEEKKNDRAMAAYAHIRFYMLEPMWKAYLDIKFNNLKTMKNELGAKTKKIVEVEKAYTEVLAIGSGEYGIAALTRIGFAYGDLAQNFLDSPDPKGLDEDQLSMYRGELENRAFPLEEKALEGLEKALVKSYELSIYNEWTILAQDKVNKYRPGLYAKVRDVPYRGAEFFVTAAVEKKAAGLVEPPPAPEPKAPPTNEAGKPATPTATAPTPGAG